MRSGGNCRILRASKLLGLLKSDERDAARFYLNLMGGLGELHDSERAQASGVY